METWEDQIAHFKSIPWCEKLLSDPNLVIRPPFSRFAKPQSRAFEFFSVTINSAATIPFFLAFMHPPVSQVEAAEDTLTTAPPEELSQQNLEVRFATKVYFLLTLGHGLTSFREGLCHGGVVAAIFDECNGAVGMANKMYGLMAPVMHVTQSMNVTYLRPVPTGVTVLLTATLVKVEGTKRFVVEGELTNGDGVVFAKAEAVYVILDRKMDIKRVGVKEKL